jgi:site-specific recombinase XerD
MLYPNQWKKGCIVNCPDAIEISQQLDAFIKNIRQVILEMVEENHIDIFSIPDRLEQMNRGQITFWQFCEQRAEVRKYGKTEGSKLRYDRFLRFFKEWGVIKDFDDITEKNIIAYDRYLEGKGLKNSSKWNNYHRFLNSFILDAIDAGYIRKNPYRWVNVERRRIDSLGKCLSPEEFNTLKSIKLPTKSLERVRDLFVFQTYTCLSYTDLSNFNPSHIQELRGTKVYVGSRNKTSHPFTVPLLSPAIAILDKYGGKLPIISNVKYNEYLKVVAQAAGIDKPVSTHWARHTGATLLLNEGVPMQIVAKICGHSSSKITEQVYAKLLDETVVDAMSGLDI